MNNFEKLIIEDRKERQQPQFRGTFIEYLHILTKEPRETILSHERIYRLITNPGMKTIKTEEDARLRRIYGNDVIKQYLFFKDNFFGIDATLMKIVRYFHSAAMKGEESRQVLYLVGPVGAGKSSIIESIKRLLENSPPIYALEGCPMREEPLHLVPKHLRKSFNKRLGMNIEGELCPVCRYRLRTEFDGHYKKFPVEQVGFHSDKKTLS